MKIECTEAIIITNEEQECLSKANKILSDIRWGMTDSKVLDEQTFPDEIKQLIINAFMIEDKKVFSVFNYLDDYSRQNIIKDMIQGENKIQKEGRNTDESTQS